jgi:hypothetical protein
MEGPLDNPGAALGELTCQVRDLQSRVCRLEEAVRVTVPAITVPGEVAGGEAGPLLPAAGEAGRLVPLLGISFLGLAAAYLLRALSEMSVLPIGQGVGLAVLYSLAWLVCAARTPADERSTAAIRGATAFLILAPLLWEAHMRFHAMQSWASAAILVGFAAVGMTVSWTGNRSVIAWIAVLTGLLTSAALLGATRDLVPFTCALLALAALVEVAACLEHWLHERWAAALLANGAVLLVTDIAGQTGGLPEGYAPIASGTVLFLQVALPAIYITSTLARTLGRRFEITVFEVVQCAAALLIAFTGVLHAAGPGSAAPLALALFCASAGASCYMVSLKVLAHDRRRVAACHAYATFALLLTLAAAHLALGPGALTSLLLAAGVICVVAGTRRERALLQWHALAYLAAGALAAGALTDAPARLLGTGLHARTAGQLPWAWLAAAACLAAAGLAFRASKSADTRLAVRVPAAALMVMAGMGLAEASGATLGFVCPGWQSGGEPRDFCPTILTGVMLAIALGLQGIAVRWRRPDIAWMPYVFVGPATWRLLTQDMRHAGAMAIVLSLLMYGAALVLLPRLARQLRRGVA